MDRARSADAKDGAVVLREMALCTFWVRICWEDDDAVVEVLVVLLCWRLLGRDGGGGKGLSVDMLVPSIIYCI